MEYMIKQVPEDFLVEEIPSVVPGNEGEYSYYSLWKKNCNTLAAIKEISRKLGINIRRMGWAGNKDKNAVTRQAISIQRADEAKIRKLNFENISLSYLGKGSQRIYIGNLAGNKFTITVRNLGSDGCAEIQKNHETLKKNGFLIPNYFDEQRFGGMNYETGKALLERKFGEAAAAIYRAEMPNPVQALAKVHGSVLSLFVHAYQSLLFNEMLSEYIMKKCSSFSTVEYSRGTFIFPGEKVVAVKLPIVGFATELKDDETGKIASDILRKHNISQRDFIIKQLPALTVEGSERDALAEAKNLEIGSMQDDELNEGKKKCVLKFELQKGSYATILIKALCC